ncbi:MAG: futalosine hydrolase [Bacteroidetes bacterium GWF2_38_335]|nr:MAG: futalosine hydrolase [Bacteroidetes bacterium GWF2_38_335]OFY79902.1 MAG: futalosine hydrolase [Bacteroidetes bacterium RIFOXYA12_FULL_38_20]
MDILLISATDNESKLLISKLGLNAFEKDLLRGKVNGNMVYYTCSGIGSASTAYKLTKLFLKNNFDLVVQFGIAGSFTSRFVPGAVVQVTEDCFADLGIDDNGQFKDLFELKYLNENSFPYTGNSIKNQFITDLSDVPEAKGITVNTASGNSDRINFLKNRFNPDVETMEGAALALVCASEKIKYLQIRAISNFVEPRNIKNWKTEAAVRDLTDKIIELLNEIN